MYIYIFSLKYIKMPIYRGLPIAMFDCRRITSKTYGLKVLEP